jgi:replication factor C small subunit
MVITNRDHTLLVEKYRPTTLEGYVGNENIKRTIAQYLDQNDIQNLIFYGPAGTGKTTLAKLIALQLQCDFTYINASDERGIETIREKVAGFAASASFKPLKVVILDEADFLTIQAQASLRNVIETFSRSTRFILTCNYVERIIDPLQSRCQVLKIIPPSKGDVAQHLAGIMEQEGVSFQRDDLKTIVNQFYPDLRKCLNTIQLSIVNDGLKGSEEDKYLRIDKSVLVSSNYMTAVLKELTQKKPSFTNIRQIIANANIQDFEELYRFLYDNANVYASGSEGMVAVYVNEYSYQANFRIDKEINAMALIAKLIELAKPQVIVKPFLKFATIWISQNLSVPFWMVGHIHLMTTIYEDIHEILASLGMNIIVLIGFILDYKSQKQQK